MIKYFRSAFQSLCRSRCSWLVLLSIIFLAWKVYVVCTPSPDDDELPDKVRDAILTVVYDRDATCAFDDDDVAFGERS